MGRAKKCLKMSLLLLLIGVFCFGKALPADREDEGYGPSAVLPATLILDKYKSQITYELNLKIGLITPQEGISPRLLEQIDTGATGRTFVIIQFFRSLDETIKSILTNLGVTILEYIPNYAFICSAPFEQLRTIGALPQVRAICEIKPEWKISPSLLRQMAQDPGAQYEVWIATFSSIDDLIQNGRRLEENLYITSINYEQLMKIAQDGRVKWIQLKPVEELSLAESVPLVGANDAWSLGDTGAGVKVGVIDSGIDPDHPHFASVNIIASYDWVDGDWTPWDCQSHGTHCAGTIAGQSTYCGTTFTGVSFAADLVIERVFDCTGNWHGGTYTQLFDYVINQGAEIVSNSWGHQSDGEYDSGARSVDTYAYNHPDVLFVFANGNYPDDTYVDSPGLAKNVVAVGAIRDGSRASCCSPTVNYSTAPEADLISSLNNLYAPADGRVKPDVVAPGVRICAPVVDGWGVKSGSSMATPHVAGLAALYRQHYPTRPAPVIKAALVASAIDLNEKSGQNSYPKGWGKVPSARDMIYVNPWESDQFYFYGSVAQGEGAIHNFTVPSFAEKIIVTLVWWDPPASELANPAIVNDLDLYVGPDSSPYQYSSLSVVNTVERVIIDNPSSGDWRITVHGYSIPGGGTQTYYGYCKVLTDATPSGSRRWSVTPSGGEGGLCEAKDSPSSEKLQDLSATVPVGTPFTLNLEWEVTRFYVSGSYVTLEPMYPQIELVDGATGYVIGELHQGEVWEAHPQFRCTEPGTYDNAIKITWGGTNYSTWTTYLDVTAIEKGVDTVGVYNPDTATFFLRNSNSAGVADITFNYGIPNWIPIAGDWDGDGIDTIGVYNPATATFFLRNSNSAGVADITFNYGIPNWVPIVGDWDGDGASTSSLSYKVLPIESESLQISCTPNPLKGEGLVTFSVAGEVEVQAIRVKVFDLAGQLIWQNEAAGNMLTWKAEDLAGRPLANGVYLYVVEVKTPEGWKTLEVRKLVILR